MEKISVIVPAYNAEKTIGKCLDTLVNQTYNNMEIIVINDGSKDNTLKIIKSYQKQYPEKIVIISRENKGIGYSRNEAIKKASGKYLGFVDSDDYVELEMYEHLYKHLKKTESDVVVCDYFEFNEKNKTIKSIVDFKPTNIYENPELINEINSAPWNKLYKKEIFNDLEYPENLKYEDLSTVLIALLKAKKISKLNEPLYDYYINMAGETNTYNYRVFDIFEIFEIIINNFPKNYANLNNELLKLVYTRTFFYVGALLDFKDKKLVLRFYESGINFLNKNFSNWRLKYINDANNFKEMIKRFIRTNKFLFKTFIINKIKKTKKSVLFTNYYMEIGGIEKALVNLLNNMDFNKYDITLLLQHKCGEFLNDIDKRVEVQSFNLVKSDFVLYRKCINMFKIIFTIIRNIRKYDFAGCYGPSHKESSLVALYASKNNAIWMHTNIVNHLKNQYDVNDDFKLKRILSKYFKKTKFRKFKNLMFVSNNSMNAYLNVYPDDKDKCNICYNFIDYKNIISLSKESIDIKKNKKKVNLVNIGRHSEYEKRITRIIDMVEVLKNKYDIKFYLIGDGPDHKMYVDLVKQKKLDKYIEFLGAKNNPYPYFLLADAVVLSSAFEGFPTVYTEALTLNIPVITTDVSDAKKIIAKKYGIVCKNDDQSFIKAVEKFIIQGFEFAEPFDPQKYNKQGMSLIERLIDNE